MTGEELLLALRIIERSQPELLKLPLFATHGNDDNGNADLIEIESIEPCSHHSINGVVDLLSTIETPIANPYMPILVLVNSELELEVKQTKDVEQNPTLGTIEPEGVYVTDTLFANWPEKDGGFRIRVLDEHGNCVEALDMIVGDPVEQVRWKEIRDLMPDDALYFQPEGAGDHDDVSLPMSVRNMKSYEVYRDYDACRKAHPEGDIFGFNFDDIQDMKFLDVDKPKLLWNEDD